jgi:general stress protein 26
VPAIGESTSITRIAADSGRADGGKSGNSNNDACGMINDESPKKEPMPMMTLEQLLDLVKATLTTAEFCFLTTLAESGQAHTRLMQPFAPEPDLTIWFGTSPNSRKVQEIRRDPRVTLGYAHSPAGAYVSLIGTAALETDLALRRRYWREAFSAFWPAGPAHADYLLIKFVPVHIEIMHIGQQVAPEPFGLKPLILVRSGAGWVVR